MKPKMKHAQGSCRFQLRQLQISEKMEYQQKIISIQNLIIEFVSKFDIISAFCLNHTFKYLFQQKGRFSKITKITKNASKSQPISSVIFGALITYTLRSIRFHSKLFKIMFKNLYLSLCIYMYVHVLQGDRDKLKSNRLDYFVL